MTDALRRFGAAYLMELRLLCLHWTYPLLHLLWAGLLWLMVRNADLVTAHAALEGQLRTVTYALVPLIGMFVAGAGASRSERLRFDGIEVCLPTGAEVMIGRWLAAVTGLATAMAAPLTIAYLHGPAESFWAGAPAFVTEGLVVLGFMAALGWCVVTLLGGIRWVYPLLAAIWLGLLTLPELLQEAQWNLPELRLLRVMVTGTDAFYLIWGRLLRGELPRWFYLFYAGAAALLLALLAWRVQVRRFRRLPVAAGAVLLCAALLTGTAAANYVGFVRQWGAAADADFDYYRSRVAGAENPDTTAETVDAYDLTADLTDPARPLFNARLTVRNRSDQPLSSFYLTLNRQLQVEEASLPFERDGDLLLFTPPQPLAPGETAEVSLRYGGPLTVIRRAYDSFPKLTFFTHENGVRLSYEAAWYPMAGRAWYGFAVPVQPGWTPPRAWLHSPAAFRLTVRAPEGFGVVSNLPPAGPGEYQAENAAWVMLMASPGIRTETVGRITLAAAPDNLPLLRAQVPALEAQFDYLKRLLPDAPAETVLVTVLDEEAGIPELSPETDDHLMIYASRWMLTGTAPATHNLFGGLVSDMFFDGEPSRGEVYVEVTRYLWYRWLNRLADEPQPALVKALWRIDEEMGEDALIRVLARLRREWREYEALPAAEREAWLRGAADAG